MDFQPNYILVVEDEPELREIYEVSLSASYSMEVIMAESGNRALEIIELKGKPKIIISDYRMADGDGLFLHNAVKAKNFKIPFVLCSADDPLHIFEQFPDIYGHVEKPSILGPLMKLLDSILGISECRPFFAPIRISLLLRLGEVNFDLFMRLSEGNFVKVFLKGDTFINTDAERFLSKDLQYLYVRNEELKEFLNVLEFNLKAFQESKTFSPEEFTVISLESIDSVESLITHFGMTPEVLEAAKIAASLAMKAVAQEKSIYELLKKRLENPSSYYATHVGSLTLLTCAFSNFLGWSSEATQMKLAMASILHDITVDPKYYFDIEEWNRKALDPMDKSAETLKYRSHPLEAATLVQAASNIPSDIDRIILQHHEAKNGLGFPRKLNSSHLNPMSCLFIITEDLFHLIDEHPDPKIALQRFFEIRQEKYDGLGFKKIFEALKLNFERHSSLQ